MPGTVTDHTGRVWPSLAACARGWDMSPEVVSRRVRDGWDLDRALTEPLHPCRSYGRKAVDDQGVEYPSVSGMCEVRDVTYNAFRFRVKRGEPLAQALGPIYRLEPIRRMDGQGAVDHEGTEFISKKAMCDHWGISCQRFDKRRRAGWTVERALTEPVRRYRSSKEAVDHHGRVYQSMTDMSRAYGLDVRTLCSRLEAGWDLERALETPPRGGIHRKKDE